MDMPVMVVEMEQTVKAWDISSKFSDLSRVIAKLREVWDRQTLSGLEQGKIVVSDELLNQSLKTALGDSTKVKEFTLTSLADNKIKVHLQSESAGTVDLICKIQQLEHDKEHSMMKLTVLDKDLPDRPILSFIVSHMSMAMVAKLAGATTVSPDIGLAFRGNDVTIDFHQAINHSSLAEIEVMGYRLLDYLVISGVTTQPGAMELETNLTVPHQVVQMLQNVL